MQQIVSVRPRREWRAIQLILGDSAVGMHRGLNVEELAIVAQKVTGRCAANMQRLFQDRFEHWGEVASRGVDDAEHLLGCGFSGERLVAFGGTLVEFALEFGVGFLQLGHPVIKHYGYSILPRYALAASEPNIALNGRFPLRLPSGCHLAR